MEQLVTAAARLPGAAVAARVTSTMPQATAMKNAYACSTPRMRGLPRSVRRGRMAAVVTDLGYGTVGYASVGCWPRPRVRRRNDTFGAVDLNADLGEGFGVWR